VTQYLSELKTKLVGKLVGYKLLDKGSSSFIIVKDNEIKATVIDHGDYVIVRVSGKDFKYDKWYTKPEHLATVLINYFSQQK